MSIKSGTATASSLLSVDPSQIRNIRSKLFGFTVEQLRLHQRRRERKPDSECAALRNCEHEVRAAEKEKLMRREGIPYLDATSKSLEELATAVLHQAKLERQIY